MANMKLKDYLDGIQTPKNMKDLMNHPDIQMGIVKSAKIARKVLEHPNVQSIIVADLQGQKRLVKALIQRFPITKAIIEELFTKGGKKKIETIGCMDLEARIGEGGLGVVRLGTLNEGVLGTYTQIKLAEMWAQISECAGFYLPVKTNGTGNGEEKTKREKNRAIIEEIRDSYSREELFEAIADEMRDKKYAVKFCNMSSLSSYSANDVEGARRFRHEFELTNSINLSNDEETGHENIVKVMFEEEESSIKNPEARDRSRQGKLFYVMELLEGGDIYEKTQEIGLWGFDEALEVIMQVADALAYAHAQGIIHRDIKPQNIMFDKDGKVKVTDFGLGKDTTDPNRTNLSQTGVAMGTPKYMPLEQARDAKHATAAADIYSLGLTLYEMITGEMPFKLDKAGNLTQIVERLRKYEGREAEFIPYPDAKPGSQEDALNKVLLKALQIDIMENGRVKKNHRRYSSMENFAEDLAKVWTWENVSASERSIDMRKIEKDQAERKKAAFWKKWKLPIVAGGITVLAGLGIAGALLFGGGDTYRDEIKATQETYTTRFAAAKKSKDEKRFSDWLGKLEKYNDKKKSPELAKFLTRHRRDYSSMVESRLEKEIKADFARAENLESQGLLVEAHTTYAKVASAWESREKDVKKKKVKKVYERNAGKSEDIRKKIWKLDGKDPAWKTLQFCVEDIKKRGDYQKVNADEYHNIAVLLAKKVVEPLAQGDTDKVPVAVKKDGTWWTERPSKLEWETRRAPGDFVATLWECYQMFKGTEEEQKWLMYARKWMNVFQQINEDNVDAFVGKTLLDNHFVAMEIDPARSETYKREIKRLCDLIVKKKWNEELGFITHYVADGEDDKSRKLYSNVAQDVVALLRAHQLFGNQEYKDKAEKTIANLLKYIKASKNPKSAQIYNFIDRTEGKTDVHYLLGSIEMYIQYAEALHEIHRLTNNSQCKKFATQIHNWLCDSVDMNDIPYFGIFAHVVPENSGSKDGESHRKHGSKKTHRLLPEFILSRQTFGDNKEKDSEARYTLVRTLQTDKNWQGVSDSDTANIAEVCLPGNIIKEVLNLGIPSDVPSSNTTNVYEMAAYFKALRKK
ncbi:MAG: serine/threonine protein kinase [Nanoarchaeota archaeon]|nr:serine/threonine protein kinase [Nanoarchaeota archaeon]